MASKIINMKKSVLTIAIVALSVLAFGQKPPDIKLTSCYTFIFANYSISKDYLASMTCDGKVFVKKGYRLLFNKQSSTITLIDKRTNKVVDRLIVDQNKNDKYNTKHGTI